MKAIVSRYTILDYWIYSNNEIREPVKPFGKATILRFDLWCVYCHFLEYAVSQIQFKDTAAMKYWHLAQICIAVFEQPSFIFVKLFGKRGWTLF